MTFALGLPRNLLIAARPSTGLSLVLDAVVCDLLAPTGQCLIVAPNAHEANLRLEQFRRHEKAAHPDSGYIRYVSTLALNEHQVAADFTEAVEKQLNRGKWAQPSIILHDRANDLPLTQYDPWLQFLPRIVETLRVHCITAVSYVGAVASLPDAATLFDAVWTVSEYANPDQRTPSYGELQLVTGQGKPLIFAAKDAGGTRTYHALREKPRAETGKPILMRNAS